MKYHLKAPARINVLGNPSDANEGDFATISMAIQLYAEMHIQDDTGIIIETASAGLSDDKQSVESHEFAVSNIPLPYDGQVDLIKGAVNRMYAFSDEFREKIKAHGFKIRTATSVPRQSGLGGSSLFVILTLAALRALYQLDPDVHNDYVLAEITQRVESKELGITCGFADRYVPIFGGLAYIDYRGKLYHKELDDEPYATYERLDRHADRLRIVAVATGLKHDSGDIHTPMRKRYLAEYEVIHHRGHRSMPMVDFMTGAWEAAWKGKIALIRNDMQRFGRLMNENHRLVNEMMTYCNFEGGAGWANNLLIETALENGALGAKLTGAGQGGSVYALVRPGEEDALIDVWSQTAADAGLDDAYIYIPRMCPTGLSIERIE